MQALQDHFRAVHPNQRFVVAKSTTSRNLLVAVVIVIIVMGGLVGYLVYSTPGKHDDYYRYCFWTFAYNRFRLPCLRIYRA